MKAERRACLAAICVCALLALAACSDDPSAKGSDTGVDAYTDVSGPDTGPDADPDINEPDAGPGADLDPSTGLSLQGQLVPTGGLSMSATYTLSGHVSPALSEQTSKSSNFRLTRTPAPSETDN